MTRTDPTADRERDAAAGIEVARRALDHLANGREGEVLATLNAATQAEVTWAAAYLCSAVRESCEARFGWPERARAAIRAASEDPEDVLMTQVGIIVEEASHG